MRNKTYIAIVITLLLAMGILLFLLLFKGCNKNAERGSELPQTESQTIEATEPDSEVTTSDRYQPDEDTTPAAETEKPYESEIDFDELKAKNEDIYAWIRIEGTQVDYPVLQSPTNDEFYLSHDSNGDKYIGGAIFSEHEYNGTDFNDPVTVLYGHYMSSGALFGGIQKYYSNLDNFRNHKDIMIYLPDAEYRYEVIAAVPFETWHILYYYDFTNAKMYNTFMEIIYNIRALDANIDRETEITPDDHLLILSTCYYGRGTERYIVVARRCD